MHVVSSEFVDCLFQEAAAAMRADRRVRQRHPFFRPVTIVDEQDGGREFPAFCRDISRSGIGLLHDTSMEIGSHLTIKIPACGRMCELGVELLWCSRCGTHWFSSGGSLRGISLTASLALLSAVVKDEFQRRQQDRYPFFRPITICHGQNARIAAFSRDISRRGMGLLHAEPVSPGRVLLGVPTTNGETRSIASDVKWCQPAGQGWYLSGVQFAAAWLDANSPFSA